MKKTVAFIALSALYINSVNGQVQQGCCTMKKSEQETCCLANSECVQEFLKGFAAGAAAGISVELLKNNVLPNLPSLNLYKNYGICKDQLAGQGKVATAVLGLAAVSKHYCSKFKSIGAQLVGIIAGACAASYAARILSPAAAPVAPAE